MKRIHWLGALAVFAAIIMLAGCGGGGGGGGGGAETPPVLYKGVLTQAPITAANSMSFFNLILGNYLALPATGGSLGPVSNAVPELRTRAAAISKSVPRKVPVSDTVPGAVSGTMRYSGDIGTDGTGTITFWFSNYNDGDGITYDGKLAFAVLAFDQAYAEITHGVMTLLPLTIRTEMESATVSGTVELFNDIAGITATEIFDVDGRNESSGETFRLQDMNFATTCDSRYQPTFCTENVSGRVYLETEGYVDVSLLSPLQIHHPGEFSIDIPDAGGPMLLAGAQQTFERITPLSVSQVRVEVDVDEDPDYELSNTYRWTDLAGVVFTWEYVYGATPNFDVALSAQETSDGGYIAAGWSNTGTTNLLDMMLVKTDAAGGLLWTGYLGGTTDDYAQAVRETADGGFVVAGSAGNYAAVYRLDAGGNPLWSRIFTSDLPSKAYSIVPTTDGGSILTGQIESYSPATGLVGFGIEDVYLVKLDSGGSVVWEKRFGGTGTDIGYSVIEIAGGGFVIAGTGGMPAGDSDIYLIRTDADGNALWERHLGDALAQYGYDVLADANGNNIVSGVSATLSGNVYSLHKVDAGGSTIWSKTFGSTGAPYTPTSVALAGDGGYVVAGTDYNGQLFRTDASGNLLWQKTLNWSTYLTMGTASSVERTSDGGFVIGGSAWPTTGKDFYLVKTDKEGNR